MIDLSSRRCMLEPIPEIAAAARLLEQAVDAHLVGDASRAASLFAAADVPQIAAWTQALWGSEDPEIHRFRVVPDTLAEVLPAERDRLRAPDPALQRLVLKRDRYHCRFCSIPLVRPAVRKHLSKRYPEVRWARGNGSQHAAFQAMWVAFDHVVRTVGEAGPTWRTSSWPARRATTRATNGRLRKSACTIRAGFLCTGRSGTG